VRAKAGRGVSEPGQAVKRRTADGDDTVEAQDGRQHNLVRARTDHGIQILDEWAAKDEHHADTVKLLTPNASDSVDRRRANCQSGSALRKSEEFVCEHCFADCRRTTTNDVLSAMFYRQRRSSSLDRECKKEASSSKHRKSVFGAKCVLRIFFSPAGSVELAIPPMSKYRIS